MLDEQRTIDYSGIWTRDIRIDMLALYLLS